MNSEYFFGQIDAKPGLTLRHSDGKTAKFCSHLLNHIAIVTFPNANILLWLHILSPFYPFCVRLDTFLKILNGTPDRLHSFISRRAELTKQAAIVFIIFHVFDECFFLLFPFCCG